jgi:hypothetical protein
VSAIDQNITRVNTTETITHIHIYQVISVDEYLIFYVVIGNKNIIHYSLLCGIIEDIKRLRIKIKDRTEGYVGAPSKYAHASIQAISKNTSGDGAASPGP